MLNIKHFILSTPRFGDYKKIIKINKIKFTDTHLELNKFFKCPCVYFFTLQIHKEMDSIVKSYPHLVSAVKIGHSFENRLMYVLKVRLHAP